ncbi:putative DNA-binding protein [Actinoplanes missouriensis 431]|uniref:Putative DNA-binding protein n=1 Tax=Actinoplanes missouriensis (strain ATCC 14538 / DSM 43046 / CBS 188.64 / JCM 3121 / NBRC 102363 / NCIMB 12654 / NRRL B-3342 / UNCC 431) TaxID=512565 RepID=I0GXJ4_ACTM4|nr:helix-turn-helix transcriptional regulator [Actinoplanes missouriensis]KOX45272.1 hypothetical protein ADL19_23435 [Streptomyces purpurogeneiscleroticus]BAL85481.1 putative DNA-binding protein [Actinoplanes missouriensis 431]
MTVSPATQAARQWATDHGHPQPDDRMLQAYEDNRPGSIRVPSTTSLGTALREIRHLHGLTLQQLADKTGINLQQLGEYERGRTMPSAVNLLKIIAAYEYKLALVAPQKQSGPNGDVA